MGVKRVISKAITYEQGCVLKKIGAEIVILKMIWQLELQIDY